MTLNISLRCCFAVIAGQSCSVFSADYEWTCTDLMTSTVVTLYQTWGQLQ